MFEIKHYSPDHKEEWNAFVASSRNGTFLFHRDYMDYHSDRFEDYSMMVYDEAGRLYALLPANKVDNVLYSHQGLSYGGLIMNRKCRAAGVRDLFVSLNEYLRSRGFRKVVYKHIPWIYSHLPAEEDLFAISNVCQASICSRNISSVVILNERLPFSTLRRRGIKKALMAGIQIEETNDFAPFWQLLTDNLQTRFQAKPVHTLAEITLLKSRFPSNIRLFTASCHGCLLGGTVLYVHHDTVKTQYISANEDGRRIGSLDLLFSRLLDKYSADGVKYFDFGTSNLVENDDLNDSLIFQKEGFGGRGVCYDTYEWSL